MRPAVPFSATAADLSRGPLLVFWELTRACDLACTHCRACARPARYPRELTTDDARRVIDDLTSFPAPPLLVLTGGDPLKRNDLDAIIAHAVRRGLRVALTPSATPLLTADAIATRAALGVAAVALSLDGPDAATHDASRGVSGSFDRTTAAARTARDLGLHVQVNTTLTPATLPLIESIANRVAATGAGTWSVFFLVPVGRGRSQQRLTAAECEQAFGRLATIAARHPFRVKTTEAPHYRRFLLEHGVPAGGPPTNDGRGVMFISHVGDVYPSGFLPVRCGRVPNDSAVTVYLKSPVFRALREPARLGGKCGACPYNAVCGGSRARAFAVTGDWLAAEPDCAFVPPHCPAPQPREASSC
ncbi:MAG TPA: radical SAM protein [Tepidisphaeraceae bacterium]|nr:radical SAM protein [Tepidisphaeraceae bacterium]